MSLQAISNQATNSQSTAQADKIKTLEAKVGKLEDDLMSAITARNQAHNQLASLKDENAQLQDQTAALQKDVEAGKEVAKERDRSYRLRNAIRAPNSIVET